MAAMPPLQPLTMLKTAMNVRKYTSPGLIKPQLNQDMVMVKHSGVHHTCGINVVH